MRTSENANIPALYRFHAVLVKGLGVFLTTVLATVLCGTHGNSTSKEWRKANKPEQKRQKINRNYTKNFSSTLWVMRARARPSQREKFVKNAVVCCRQQAANWEELCEEPVDTDSSFSQRDQCLAPHNSRNDQGRAAGWWGRRRMRRYFLHFNIYCKIKEQHSIDRNIAQISAWLPIEPDGSECGISQAHERHALRSWKLRTIGASDRKIWLRSRSSWSVTGCNNMLRYI